MGGTGHTAPPAPRYRNAYLFGAICPARGPGAAILMPKADTHALRLHLDESSPTAAKRAHAVVPMERAGWPTTGKLDGPGKRTIILPPSPSPEPVENIRQFMRQTGLSNRVFETYDAILEAACAAGSRLVRDPNTIPSIGMRNWAHNGQS